MRILCLILCFSVIVAQDSPKELHTLFEDYKEFNLVNYPIMASYNGDHRFADELTNHSKSAVERRFNELAVFLAKSQAIDTENLNSIDKDSKILFELLLQKYLEGQQFEAYLFPINQQNGLHISFPQILSYQPSATQKDYDNYYKRMKAFSREIDHIISNMTEGISKNKMLPDFVVEQIIEQIDNILAIELSESIFAKFGEGNSELPADVKSRLQKQSFAIIKDYVYDAYNRLKLFLQKEYLPFARIDAGIWSLPNGVEQYNYHIFEHTTTRLSADEIFTIGQAEVARIKSEMLEVLEDIEYGGTLDSFIQDLRVNPQYYYTKKEDLLNGFQAILDQMDPQLPNLFGVLPKAPYALKEMEAFRAKSAPQAYYYRAPLDGSRPGYFYVNTYNLPSRPKYTMTALALHEAVPGHHLQISIAQELENMPWFRQGYSATAFVEGWGLYAEYLGYETEMYTDPLQHFGALTFEMWRACRLVVDVGIHAKKWTREDAVQYMLENTPNSELDIRSEVDRYIAWPGQALAYKMGELKIKELRTMAEEELGEAFDIQSFHDALLENGAIPLSFLEEKIEAWIDKNR